jgi:uncharacterized membrane protein YeaQ/YmgE (transglycosylase-associated protein family)
MVLELLTQEEGVMPPALALSLVLGSMEGILFHLLWPRQGLGLWLNWLIGAIAFLLSQVLAEYIAVTGVTIGDVHPIEGILLTMVLLLIANWVRRSR